mgnify:CR=1 FL=1
MNLKFLKTFAVVALITGKTIGFASANEDVITKSLTFHYNDYPASAYSQKVAVENWNSKEGIARLERTKFKGDFYRLANHYKPQNNPASCGQATATIILSAIYAENNKSFPVIEEWPINIGDKKYPLQYRLINETNFFNNETDKILDRRAISMKITKKDGTFGGGIDIDELQDMLKVHGVKSKLTIVEKYSEENLAKFRDLVKEIVNSDKEFLILNYDHSYKSLMGGHFSPVIAYDEQSDSVLMLDVAGHRNPWVWINISDIYHAMNTKNYAQTSYRGYLVIKNKIK